MALKHITVPGAALAALLALPATGSAVVPLDSPDSTPAVASAEATEPVPSEVTDLTAQVVSGGLQVTGSAIFGGQAPVLIADDNINDGKPIPQASTEMGLDLTTAWLYQADPDDPTLTFEWNVTNLPDSGSIPEVVRYLSSFSTAGETFQLQAKHTNVASITLLDDTEGHIREPGTYFQLRADCGPQQIPVPEPLPQEGPVTNCPHQAWLDGEFDVDNNMVRIDLPIGAEFAPEIVPGAVLEPFAVAGSSIAASYQAMVSNDQVSDVAIWEPDDYTVPSKQVLLGIAPEGTPLPFVAFDSVATLNEDGTFDADLDLTGRAPGNYELFAKACFGDNCGMSIVGFTIQ